MNANTLIAGRYRVIAELGSGGFGAVYRVEDAHANGAMRALKTLKPNANISQLAERFKEEAKALSSLKHAGAPKCWDFGEDEEIGLYFVLDYIEGQTLLDRLESGSMSLAERFQRAIEFFDVLGHVHGRGILHRDIKPENLMVPKDGGHLILLDFGIAKDLAQSAVHTATGVILGTPYYLTPEQLVGERYTAKSDLYQAALVTYWLLTGGSHCFAQVDSVAQLLVQRQMAPRVGALERTSWYGRVRGLVKPLLDCLEPKPESRPGTARIVRDALAAMADAVLGEGRVAPPTVDGVAAPVRKVSGKVSRPTVVQGSAVGAQTVVAEAPPAASRSMTPGGTSASATAPADPLSLQFRVITGALVVTLLGTGALVLKGTLAPRPVEESPSAAIASPVPSCEDKLDNLRRALRSFVGDGGRDISAILDRMRPHLKKPKSRTWFRDSLLKTEGSSKLANLESALEAACPATVERGEVTVVDASLFNHLGALEVLDETATSIEAMPSFERQRERLLGRLVGQREFVAFSASQTFGCQYFSPYDGETQVEWTLRIPAVPDSDADMTIIGNGFDPKAILEITMNGLTKVNFRNRTGAPQPDVYPVPKAILPDGRVSSAFNQFTPNWPLTRLVSLTRRVPRAAFRAGENRLSFRFIPLPGPLRLPGGRQWTGSSKVSVGSLWHLYASFARALPERTRR